MNASYLPRFWILVQLVFTFALSAATHTLTVNINGSGTVATNPTAEAFPHNSTVTLTANAAANWQFTGWSGAIGGALNPTNVLMDADKVITANFSAIPTYTLAVNTSGAGSVAPNNGTFLSNSPVQLTATASNGWAFHHWIGDASGNANPLSVTMSGNKSITAVFIQPIAIVTPPQSITRAPGDSASFTVVAGGTGPLIYAWDFNGSIIPGADTPVLALNNVQPSNAGPYRVVVTSPYGSTNAVATLTVSCPGTNVVSVATDAALRSAMTIGGNVRLCFSGTVTLTNTIFVSKNTTIDASGISVIINGNNAVRLFDISSNVTFALTNLVLTSGKAVATNLGGIVAGGAAILSRSGNVTLISCEVSNHTSTNVYGGAIACVGGSFFAKDCRFISNTIRGTVAIPANQVQGGALFGQNTLVQISDSLMGLNLIVSDSTPGTPGGESTAQLGGGAMAVALGTTVLHHVIFTNNTVAGGYTRNGFIPGVGGGAIYNRGTLAVMDCTFDGNQVQGSGGFTTGAGDARGGALDTSGNAFINGSVFRSNVVRGGIGRNTGIPPGFPSTAGIGGAINNGGTLFITNSTVAQNSAFGGAPNSPGYYAGDAYGGGIHCDAGSVMLVNVTLATNTANVPLPAYSYGGISRGMNLSAMTNHPITLRNSIIAGASNNVWGTNIDGGYNMSSDGSANFNSGTSFNFTDPHLLALANNGGPTLTMALAPDSPAIDWVPAANAPATDQRGVFRPYGTAADVGAFEVGAPLPWLSIKHVGSSIELSFPVWAGIPYRIEHSTALPIWLLNESLGVVPTNGTVTRTIPRNAPSESFRVVSY